MTGLFEALRGTLNFIDRDIQRRKRQFGVELYDYVDALFETDRQTFLATEENQLIVTVRPSLLVTQREIAALCTKRKKIEQDMEAGGNQKWKFRGAAKLVLVDRVVKQFKEQFGLDLYDKLVSLEETKQWLASDPEIRTAYEQCRGDIEKLLARKTAKEKELTHMETQGVAPDTVEDGDNALESVGESPQPRTDSPLADGDENIASSSEMDQAGVSPMIVDPDNQPKGSDSTDLSSSEAEAERGSFENATIHAAPLIEQNDEVCPTSETNVSSSESDDSETEKNTGEEILETLVNSDDESECEPSESNEDTFSPEPDNSDADEVVEEDGKSESGTEDESERLSQGTDTLKGEIRETELSNSIHADSVDDCDESEPRPESLAEKSVEGDGSAIESDRKSKEEVFRAAQEESRVPGEEDEEGKLGSGLDDFARRCDYRNSHRDFCLDTQRNEPWAMCD